VVFGRICLAHGSIAPLCTGRLSMVLALAATVPAFGLRPADCHLDREHSPYILRLASAHTWTPVVGSWLDYAVRIRVRRHGRCDYVVVPEQTSLSALYRLK